MRRIPLYWNYVKLHVSDVQRERERDDIGVYNPQDIHHHCPEPWSTLHHALKDLALNNRTPHRNVSGLITKIK